MSRDSKSILEFLQGLLLGFVWRRVEYPRQAQFRELATLIRDDTGRPEFFGRVTE